MKYSLLFSLVLLTFLHAYYCYSRLKNNVKSETESNSLSKYLTGKKRLDSKTIELLQEAKSVQKPFGYKKILKKAKSRDKHPETVVEIGKRNTGRGFMTYEERLWDYKMIIVIDPEFTEQQQKDITAAIYTLKKIMKCFDFQVATGSTISSFVDHLQIRPKDESTNGVCTSKLGRRGGRQVTIISTQCINFYGVTMHEIMHVLGFYHEHVRPDRDKYVTVHWNLLTSKSTAHQYEVRTDQKVLIKQYDFESVMHYSFDDFMTPKGQVPQDVTVGQRSHLSPNDIKRLRKAYPCKTD